MMSVCIFGGTTEGRELAETLAKAQIPVIVSVATEYGEEVMEPSPYITVYQGRLDKQQMKAFLEKEEWYAVVDATHPFATQVSEQIKECLHERQIPYLRLQRNTENKENTYTYYEDTKSCIEALRETTGAILLTTGSKEVSVYTGEPLLKKRLFVRVLPSIESIGLCQQAGLTGKQIIAMQGPFSEEMNLAMMKQYHIAHLVTKESGHTGGVDEKLLAAKKAGICVHMIGNPEKEKGMSFEELLAVLQEKTGKALYANKKLQISLVGLGMGQEAFLTIAGQEAIEEADYLFGASRLLEGLQAKKEKYPYYLAKDIQPVLEKLVKKKERCKIAILFSGDTGFYSGCSNLYQALKLENDMDVRIIPGISTVSALSAKLGITWQDAKLMSIHGSEEAVWKSKVLGALRQEKKLFLLLSGKEQLRQLGSLCESYAPTAQIYVGRQLSYKEETIERLTPQECSEYEKDGLLACMICQEIMEKRILTPGRKDETFLRGKVPMTKEEVRAVSICKLGIHKESVIYDIGSGTGSIAVELSLLSPESRIYAIEQKDEAVDLIKSNVEKFGALSVKVIHGMAPACMEELEPATHAFIGGSKGNLFAILEGLYEKNNTMRVVINAISLETIAELSQIPKRFPVSQFEVTQLQVSHGKALGAYHLMQAENPVMICSFTFVPGGHEK